MSLDGHAVLVLLYAEATRCGIPIRVAETLRNLYFPQPLKIEMHRDGRTDASFVGDVFPIAGISLEVARLECCVLAHELGHHVERVKHEDDVAYIAASKSAYHSLNVNEWMPTGSWLFILREETRAWINGWAIIGGLGAPINVGLRLRFVRRAIKALKSYVIGMMSSWL